MSQYISQINVTVSSPDIWKRFTDKNIEEFELKKLAKTDQRSFIINNNWSCIETNLIEIVHDLSKPLANDGIIISHTTNINLDPYTYCVFYLGENIRIEEFNEENQEEKCEMFSNTDVSDISGWLNYGEFSVSEKEKKTLFRLGVAYSEKQFVSFSGSFDLPDKIYLRRTSFEDRTSIIDKITTNESVSLVHAADSFDSMRLEVISKYGSLGYIPSDVSDNLTPLLLNDVFPYSATVVEVVKLSERNIHAKSPIVAIHIVTGQGTHGITKKCVKPAVSLGRYSPKPDNCEFVFDIIDKLEFEGKIFVLTGFNDEEKERIADIIVSNGGEVKSSTVLKTNYLIVMEAYDHKTTKYNRAIELKENGKEIYIIGSKRFYELAQMNEEY